MVNQQILEKANLLWNYLCRVDEVSNINSSQLIIGLGSYDLRVAKHCAELYLSGYGEEILFTGKSGNWTVGRFAKSEAEVFADIAMDLGVPASKIWVEVEAENIGSNIKLSRQLLEDKSCKYAEIILVTKPNTTRRAYATFKSAWHNQNVVLSAPNYTLDNPADGFTTMDLIHELVGDLERVIRYPELGFQIYQEVPVDVYNAYVYLRENGFTNHCLI